MNVYFQEYIMTLYQLHKNELIYKLLQLIFYTTPKLWCNLRRLTKSTLYDLRFL
jgi:hypothetical protein